MKDKFSWNGFIHELLRYYRANSSVKNGNAELGYILSWVTSLVLVLLIITPDNGWTWYSCYLSGSASGKGEPSVAPGLHFLSDLRCFEPDNCLRKRCSKKPISNDSISFSIWLGSPYEYYWVQQTSARRPIESRRYHLKPWQKSKRSSIPGIVMYWSYYILDSALSNRAMPSYSNLSCVVPSWTALRHSRQVFALYI